MACPDFQTLMLPMLQEAAGGQEISLASLRAGIAKRLALSAEDLAERIPSGRQSRFLNRGSWAAIYLAGAGLLEWVRRGTYKITPRGLSVLGSAPERIDIALLDGYPEFKAWRTKSGSEEVASTPPRTDEPSAVATPEEQIEAGYESLRRSVEAELINKILAASPAFFERLVVDLLVAMGYGGSAADAGHALGRSGDEGLDGIIKEDHLGLDAIYIQAKRWDPRKHSVQRADVQAFAGSLEGARARKGVFITTSSFSSGAHEYVAKIEKKIVLIDGPRLAGLLFDHGVAVRAKMEYKVKEVDEEYFQDD